MTDDSLPTPVQLPGSTAPRGYSDGTLQPPGTRVVALGGHVAFDLQRQLLHHHELVPQVRQTLTNLKATLEAAGGTPAHLIKLTIHVKDVAAYRANLREIGAIWIEVLGKAFPAMTLIGVADLFDEGAEVEIDGWAAIPLPPAS